MNFLHLGGTAREPEDVKSLYRLGLQFAEIPISDTEKFLPKIAEFRDLMKSTAFYYLCHGPREGNPNNIYTLENVYLPKLLKILSLMPELDMTVLTIHLWLDPRFLEKDAVAYKINFLKRIVERAEDSDISICLENMSERAGDLEEAFESVPSLGLTLDIGHAQLLSPENTSYGYFERFPDKIKHIHIHDNHGGTSPADDLHLPIGEGSINYKKIFGLLKKIRYDGTMTLELKPDEIGKCLAYVTRLIHKEA